MMMMKPQSRYKKKDNGKGKVHLCNMSQLLHMPPE